MIVWGGRSEFAPASNKNDGAIYDPSKDSWRPMSTDGAPSARSQMAAVWTGQELLVWGGWADGGECPTTGGAYDPRTDTWTPLTVENAPEARLEPASVWTGSEMIVWGGLLQDGKRSSGTGGRYNPETKSWKALPMENAPPSARGMQAVWTGSEMIVWSGSHLDGETAINIGMKTGGRYNPRTDSWQPTTVNGAPDGRLYYGAAWTGDEMIVWSGGDQANGNLSSGGRYDPARDKWRPTSTEGAPPARGIMTSVWTGEGVLIFGGSTGGVPAFNDLHYFRPNAKAVPGSQ
jgi:N-acetylneuraminic acid mutarotase